VLWVGVEIPRILVVRKANHVARMALEAREHEEQQNRLNGGEAQHIKHSNSFILDISELGQVAPSSHN